MGCRTPQPPHYSPALARIPGIPETCPSGEDMLLFVSA